jgi:D-alanyl-D-alanine carboxypeptidase/D-alanyl-D-alanine-endopeptidase (penicillin-binding protein 4)
LQKGIAAQEIVVENGSGLSRKERVAPRTLARLLESAWFAPIGPELASSLPVAGVDGTLKRRFAGTAIAGRAHLKTGFLDNVRSIAGFLHGQQGRTLIVVSIINHPNARAATGVQDALLEWAGRTLTESTGCAGMQSASPHPCTRTRPP